MRQFIFFLLFVYVVVSQEGLLEPLECLCLNGGVCEQVKDQDICRCPTQFIGKYCQTETVFISNSSKVTELSQNYTFFSFIPNQPNYYKFSFQLCMANNPQGLESLIFMEVQKQDGSIDGEPSFFSSAKIKIQEGECMSFSTQFIQIKKPEQGKAYPKIVFGIRALRNSFKNYFFRSIPAKHHRDLPENTTLQEIDRQQSEQQFTQRLFFNANWQLYQQTTTERVLRTSIKIMLFLVVGMFIFIFGKITLYSYNLEPRDALLCLQQFIRTICRKICPTHDAKSYRHYLHIKMQDCLYSRPQDHPRDECAICLQPFDQDEIIRQTNCQHIYHQSCLDGWSTKHATCPLCRQQLHPKTQSWFRRFLEG